MDGLLLYCDNWISFDLRCYGVYNMNVQLSKGAIKMAGIFGLFDYTKEGPGVDKNAPPLKGLPLFFSILINHFFKLVGLNLIFLLFCIPVVTIPASIAGMTFVLRNLAEEKPVFLWSDFWDAFKSNFKQSLFYGLLLAAAIALFTVSIPFYNAVLNTSILFYIPGIISLTLAFVFALMNFYVFLMIVSVDLKLGVILNNAFRLSFIALWRNLLTLILVLLLAFAAFLFFPFSLIFLLFIWFSFVGLLICFRSFPVIKKHVIKSDAHESEETKRESIEPIFKD